MNEIFCGGIKRDTFVKSKDRLGFVSLTNLQVTVINQRPNYSMGRSIANSIFYERIKNDKFVKSPI